MNDTQELSQIKDDCEFTLIRDGLFWTVDCWKADDKGHHSINHWSKSYHDYSAAKREYDRWLNR